MPTPVIDKAAWQLILRALPAQSHPLQSWEWGEFKRDWSWRPVRLAWYSTPGRAVAAAQILRRPLFGPWSMLYAPKGPLWPVDNLAVVEQVLADLEAYARRHRALFIKIDPDVPLGFGGVDETPYPPGLAAQSLLRRRGWRYAGQQIQFKNTVLLDLTPSEADLLAAMKPKWRYNIRLAGRRGVSVRPGAEADLPAFFRLYATTSRRDGFLIRPEAYYLAAWRRFLQANRAALLLACVNSTPVAGLMLFFSGQAAWYMYGASDNESRNLMPNHLLQWEAVKTAKARGCTTYDMWGAPDVFDETDSMWGVYRFKTGFGGLTRRGLGAYDYPVFWPGYVAYNRLLPNVPAVLRRFF